MAKELGGTPPFFSSEERYENYQKVDTPRPRTIGSAAAYKLQDVNVACNGGWMHDLEDAVKPLLIPMIRGEREDYPLDLAQQKLIATWWTKTILAFDAYQSRRWIPESVGTRKFFDDREPASRVFLGAYVRPLPDDGVMIPHVRRRLKTVAVGSDVIHDDAIRLTFAFKHLLLQGIVVVHGFDGPIELPVPPDDVPLLQLWPPKEEVVLWPPFAVFDFRAFAAIS